MEFLGQQDFGDQHKEAVTCNPDRGCFDKQTLEDYVRQNLGKILVIGMRVVAFALVAAKVSIHQDYNPNYNSLDSVVNRYNSVVATTSHNMVIQLVNK